MSTNRDDLKAAIEAAKAKGAPVAPATSPEPPAPAVEPEITEEDPEENAAFAKYADQLTQEIIDGDTALEEADHKLHQMFSQFSLSQAREALDDRYRVYESFVTQLAGLARRVMRGDKTLSEAKQQLDRQYTGMPWYDENELQRALEEAGWEEETLPDPDDEVADAEIVDDEDKPEREQASLLDRRARSKPAATKAARRVPVEPMLPESDVVKEAEAALADPSPEPSGNGVDVGKMLRSVPDRAMSFIRWVRDFFTKLTSSEGKSKRPVKAAFWLGVLAWFAAWIVIHWAVRGFENAGVAATVIAAFVFGTVAYGDDPKAKKNH